MKKLVYDSTFSTVCGSFSMHAEVSDVNYKTSATGNMMIILILNTAVSASNITFKVWDHTVADTTPTGTPEYDFTSSPLD